MAKTIHYLLIPILLTLRSNAYAWSCSFNNDDDGWYQDGSMVCDGIDPQVALEEHYCTWYRPQDPVCQTFIEPICVDSIEYRTLSCPPNYQGGIQESRNYVCQQASWTNWSITSDNCTPNPPTCNSSFDNRIVACASGYEGQISQQKISTCPDPYGDPIWSDWTDISNSCKQSITNVENPTSPISPLNTESPTNPVSILDAPIVVEQEAIPMPQVSEQVGDAMGTGPSTSEATPQSSSEKADNKVNDTSTTSSKQADSKEVDKKDGDTNKSKNDKQDIVDGTKEIVHGFGVVLSMDLLQKPMDFYQPPLEDPFSIIQEFPVERKLAEELYIDIFKQSDLQNDYYNRSNSAWEWLRRGDLF